MCNPFRRATPWEISTLLSAPFSIRLIQGEIITKLQHLLIGSYFNTCTDLSINDIKTHKGEMFFFLYLAKEGGFPMCTLGLEKKLSWVQNNLLKLYTKLNPSHRDLWKSLYIFVGMYSRRWSGSLAHFLFLFLFLRCMCVGCVPV